jgi:hypothetical protein
MAPVTRLGNLQRLPKDQSPRRNRRLGASCSCRASVTVRLSPGTAVNKSGFRNGPLGVKPPSDDLATVIVLPFVVDTRVATSCHQMGAGEPI